MDPTLVWLIPAYQIGGGPIVPPPAPGQPPSIWPSPGFPAHPIAPGGPGQPPGIWPDPGYPAHPIAPGGPGPGLTPPPSQPPPQAAPAGFAWTQAVVPQQGWEWVAMPTATPKPGSPPAGAGGTTPPPAGAAR